MTETGTPSTEQDRHMTIAHCSRSKRGAVPTQLEQFADGTPSVEACDRPPLKLEPGMGSSRICHRHGTYKSGFDKAAFGSPETFAKILDEHSLPRQPIVVDTTPEDRELFEYGVYVWVNDRVVLVSKYNPLTGRAVKMHSCQSPDPGKAHYIGLEGERAAVTSLADTLSQRLQNGYRVDGERRYI